MAVEFSLTFRARLSFDPSWICPVSSDSLRPSRYSRNLLFVGLGQPEEDFYETWKVHSSWSGAGRRGVDLDGIALGSEPRSVIDFEDLAAGTVVTTLTTGGGGISGDPVAGFVGVNGFDPTLAGNGAMVLRYGGLSYY